jgi:membrane peptidoglycan carboxypeptidase
MPSSQPPRRRILNYPRWGRTGWTRWLPSWKLIFALCAAGFLLVLAGLFAIYASITIPPPDTAAEAQTTVITFDDGKSELARVSVQDRESVSLAQVPKTTRNAVLAAEDHTFYTNSGVDPKSIARAVWANVRGHSQQGGSTISQQYVKNVYNARQKTFKRKVTEAFLAIKINKTIQKDPILERYLNTIYWGRGAYGIQSATHAYFGPKTDVSKLTVSQGAYLAGIINAPGRADPRDGPQEKARALFRWNTVLDAMVKEGWLSPDERAKQKFPKVIVAPARSSATGQDAYLKEMVEDEVSKDTGLTRDQIETGGYKVVTTFDQGLVNAGVKAVRDKLPKSTPKSVRIGMASIDPRTGEVKAIYGGTDINKQLNQATKDHAQGGSTFKAFGLIAALKSGVSLKTEYNSSISVKAGKKTVTNFSSEDSLGYVNLIKATELSINTVYVQLNRDVGPSKMQAAAYAAGIPEFSTDYLGRQVRTDLDRNLVNVLGSTSVHPIDMASAYGTFADNGIRHAAYSVRSVSKIDTGKVIWKVSPNHDGSGACKTGQQTPAAGCRAFDADNVADLTYALQQVVQHGTAAYAGNNLGRPAAGKTGTSTNSKSAWFVGYTPQLVTAVAMHEEGKKVVKSANGKKITVPTTLNMKGFGGVPSITGGTYPTQIWTEFMKAALRNAKVLDFPQPSWGGSVPANNYQPLPTTSPIVTQGPPPTQDPGTPEPTLNTPSAEPSDTPQPTTSGDGAGNTSPTPTQAQAT